MYVFFVKSCVRKTASFPSSFIAVRSDFGPYSVVTLERFQGELATFSSMLVVVSSLH